MSTWKDEADFLKDVESISEFYIPGDHNKPSNKFVFKSSRTNKPGNTPWYEDSESDDSVDYSFGRGRKMGSSSRNPGEEPNHLDVMREIQMQVRSAVGNRYNNEVLESYYNVAKDDPPTCESPTSAPKEISILYAKEQHTNSPVKTSVAESIVQSTAKVNSRANSQVNSPVASSSSSASSSPRKGRNRRKFGEKASYKNSAGRGQSPTEYSFPFATKKREINFSSKDEFPPL